MKRIIAAAMAVMGMIFISGCVTTGGYKETRAIESGARWGSVGAVTGALIGVAGQTDIGRAAALGALVLGVPAMGAEILKETAPPPPVAAAPPVHLPGPKEVYISGWIEPEVRWEIVRELRGLGYQVTEEYSAPLQLRIELMEISDPKYICIVYLVDRSSGRVIAQGRGEVCLFLITEERRIVAKIQAAIAAIRSLN